MLRTAVEEFQAVPVDPTNPAISKEEEGVEDCSDARDPISFQISALEEAASVHLSTEELWAKLDAEGVARDDVNAYLHELECGLNFTSCVQILVFANLLHLTPDDVLTKTVIFIFNFFFLSYIKQIGHAHGDCATANEGY